MRILRLISSTDPAGGGPVEGIKQVTPHLTLRGHTTEVASFDAVDADWLTDFPCPVHALSRGWSDYHLSRTWLSWLRDNSPRFDVVVIHGVWQFTSFGAWIALKHSSIPYFLYPHGMLDPWFERTYPIKHLKKLAYWKLAEHHVLRDARAVMFTSEQERELARLSFTPYSCHDVVVSYGTSSPQGDVTNQKQAFLSRFPLLAGKRLILFLGRIHPKKGCDLLIQAFSQFAQSKPDLHLVLAGPDQVGWVKTLQTMAHDLGITTRLTFTGLLQGDLKWGAFYSSAIFALPSHQENFGISVVEALACGLPVLISNQVNIWHEIANDNAGLVAPDTLDGMSSMLNQWLTWSPEVYERYRVASQKCFLSRFEISHVAESFIRIVESNID